MTKVLLIWDNEAIEYYLLDCNDYEVELLKIVNNNFIGESDITSEIEEKILYVHDALYNDKSYCTCKNEAWACKWADKEIQLPFEPDEKIDLIITTGQLQ